MIEADYPNRLELSAKMRTVSEYVFYDATTILGEGSSAKVYKGYHNQEQKIVACKIIPARIWKIGNNSKNLEK